MSDPADAQVIGSPSHAAFSPGGILSNARQLRGLSIGDVAHALKLAPRQVEAIEADAFDQLRGLTFARGFVRNYARHLGIDPDPLLEAIVPATDSPQVELAPISNARGEMPNTGSSLGSLLPAGMTLVVLIALALAGWYFGWFRVPTVPAEKAESSSPPVRDERIAALPAPVAEPTPAPAASLVSAAVSAPAASAAGAAASPPAPAEPAVGVAPTPAPGTQRLAFVFEQDSWVEIKDSRGRIVHSQLHKAGATDDVDVGGKPPYALVIGNAAKVKLRFNDRQIDLLPFVKISVARLSLE